MKARDAGKMNLALLYWQQAKTLRPSIAKPHWLLKPPEKKYTPKNKFKKYKIISTLPYKEAKPIIDEMLKKNPTDLKLRKLYVDKARKAGDIKELKRNNSIIQNKQQKNKNPKNTNNNIWLYFKFTLIIVFILLVIWQFYIVISENKALLEALKNKDLNNKLK